jgi:luciferase-type oxidoreductase
MGMESALYRPAAGSQTRPALAAVGTEGVLSLGLMLPIEAFRGDTPKMAGHLEAANLAERLGFASLGFRDVPLRDPNFGDVGQVFDPWVYLGYIAAHTQRIALLTTSIILPLRHPLHTAKAAATVDHLSGGRLLLGVASGDRPSEFPAFAIEGHDRGELLREQLPLLRRLWSEQFPVVHSRWGEISGTDVVPKPFLGNVPLLVTGHSQSDLSWIAEHADGWLMYPRTPTLQSEVIREWRKAIETYGGGRFKPFLQSYYIDLADSPTEPATPIHLGHRLGRLALQDILNQLRAIGVNHVVFNLKYGRRPAIEVVQEIGEFVLPRLCGNFTEPLLPIR